MNQRTDAGGTPATHKPLAGLRILDLGTMVAGPAACTFLADFGAEVIKVEQPNGGDTLRGLGPFKNGESLWWLIEGRNKKSVTIDLRQKAGQELLLQLAAKADAVVENFRPGTMENWNVGFDRLAAVNPRLVMLSVSGFGQSGPYSRRAGYDRIGLAFSGVMGITGYPDRPPVRVGISVADYSTATLGAFSVMMALYHRDRTGQGQQIDLSLYETMFRYTDTMIGAFDAAGLMRKRTGNVHLAAAPGTNFETKDGRFIVLTISGDTLFRKLCNAIGHPALADEPKYASHTLRFQHVEELNAIVGDWIKSQTVKELGPRLDEHGVAYSVVYTVEDIMEDPHYAARGNILEVQHPVAGAVKMPGIVPRLVGRTPPEPTAAPALGSHNAEIFQGLLGLDDAEMARLRAARVI
jgi:crotonobetainyl-CoA:carnitine CoA-transferase CaiB-like acyl-CoA transferase